MSPAKIRVYLGAISTFLLVLTLVTLYHIFCSYPIGPTREASISLVVLLANIFAVFVWVGWGKGCGAIASFFPALFVYFFYTSQRPDLAITFLLPTLGSVFIGYKFADRFFLLRQKYMVEIEKIEGKNNLLKNKLGTSLGELTLLEGRLSRFSYLNKAIEKFSSSLSKDEIIKIIVELAYRTIGKSDRILLFLLDPQEQELKLTHSKRIGDVPYIKLKNGDIFDRWILKRRQPFLIEDINNDFRFSLVGEKIDKGFNAIISVPLAVKDKVFGVLRMDSKEKSFYSQDDLRLLDIISDLASVALENAILYERVNDLAITDGLTSLYVQKYFKERLSNETKRALKSGKSFSLAIIDIDDFKEYNDKYGHTAGDLVLKLLSELFKESLRAGDMAARYGGEEFALILLGRDKKNAVLAMEALRKKIENTPVILRREKTVVTVSIGISTCPEDSTLGEDLIREADKRLYTAKGRGKNCICAK